MVIRVAPDVADRLVRERSALLLVRSPAEPDRLTEALATAATDIWGLGGEAGSPAFVSEPVPTPEGPMLLLDLDATPDAAVRALPDVVSARLTEAGVDEAEVALLRHESGRLERLERLGPSVRCWLRGRAGTADLLPALAEGWLRERAGEGTPWFQYAGGAFFPLAQERAAHAVTALLGAGWEASLVVSDFATTAHAAGILVPAPPAPPQAALGAVSAGPDLVAELLRARELVRAHADRLCWAGAGTEPDARDLTTSTWQDRTRSHRQDPGLVPDLLVPDGLWYQLLTEGHLARLGGLPEGAAELLPGVAELTVGEPEQWLPGHPDREAVRARARDLLRPCLASPDRLHALSRERLAEHRG